LTDTNKKANLVTSENNQKAFDADKAEVFSEKLLTALNYGSLSLMMSIGHRTGIFDAMRALPPSTSEEVAKSDAGIGDQLPRVISKHLHEELWQKHRVSFLGYAA
jgi:hypothetical protein